VEIEVTDSGELAAPSEGRQHVGRRALFGAGLGGAALSLLPLLSGRASASATTDTAGTDTASTEAATTTTAPPQRPTSADVTLLGLAQQVEATAVALYNEALKVIGWSDEQAVVMTFIRDAHLAYAQALSGLLGRDAPNIISQEVFDAQSADFSGTVDAVLASAGALESTLVATHGDVIATLVGTDGASLIASIQINEARYCTALADLAGDTDNAVLLVDEEAASLAGKG
jgi:hypothetical protein